MADVEAFASAYKLDDILDLLIRGAKVARDPDAYKGVPGLTDKEKAALEREKKVGFWRQTKELRATIFTCAIAAILQYVFKAQDSSYSLISIVIIGIVYDSFDSGG